MESFGLFNFLKSLLSPGQTEEEEPPVAPPSEPLPPAPPPAKKQNPCVGFLERHERISENISKKTKK